VINVTSDNITHFENNFTHVSSQAFGDSFAVRPKAKIMTNKDGISI
jgi:hypothetical protein